MKQLIYLYVIDRNKEDRKDVCWGGHGIKSLNLEMTNRYTTREEDSTWSSGDDLDGGYEFWNHQHVGAF